MPLEFELDLESAWRNVVGSAFRDELPDVIRYVDYSVDSSSWLAELADRIASGSYVPSPATVIDVPKAGLTSRPMARMAIPDRVVLEAIADVLAVAVERALPECVFGGRTFVGTDGRIRMRSWRDQWLQWQAAVRAHYETGVHNFLLATDVTAFYQYVNVPTLAEDLRRIQPNQSAVADYLERCLLRLAEGNTLWGLPQGHRASSILSNVYLLPIDRELEHLDVAVFRFADDYRVFAGDTRTLRTALRRMEVALRKRRLNLGSAKTRIVTGRDIGAEFEDDSKKAIEYGIRLGDEASRQELRMLFDQAVAMTPINTRDIRFCVWRFAELGDDYAAHWIADNLADAAFVSHLLPAYLASHFGRAGVADAVHGFLVNEAGGALDYVVMHLVRTISSLEAPPRELLAEVWKILDDPGRPTFLREHAARCVGRHAKPGEVDLLRLRFEESDPEMQRALLIAMHEGGGIPDDLQGLGLAESHGIHRTIRYLKSRARLPAP